MIKGYYFITDAGLSKNGNINDVQNAIEAGVNVVQYRSNEAGPEEGKVLREVCPQKTLFIINDSVDLALSVGADGVHLGQQDMLYERARELLGKDKIIGMTVRNLKEARTFEKKGADYLSVGPIFATSTKKDAGEPCGIGLIREIKEACKVPIVAIGGISFDNAEQVINAGADAICAISAVVTKDDVKKEIKRFQALFA